MDSIRQQVGDRQVNKARMAAMAFSMAFAVILAVGAVVPAQAQTYNINFPAPTTFQIDACPVECNATIAAAIADMNGDGNLDVVNIDGHNDINVMLGNGNGTFQSPITLNFYGLLSSGDAIAVGDFNGDHIPDVAVWGAAYPNSNSAVQIFLGNGNGTFTAGGTFAAVGSGNDNPPNTLVAVDVNGDGILDLVALTPYTGVYVFIGNGDGTFQTPVNYATLNPNGPNQGLAVGDVNGDGHPDIAIGASNGLDILLNNGNGTFGAAAYYQGPSGFSAGGGIAIGVLKGKTPDVLVTSDYATGFATFLNQGNGTFTAGTLTSVPGIGSTDNLVLADLSNNGKLDVVVPDGIGDVYTFFGTGKGTFTAGPEYPLTVYGCGNCLVQVGDFNNDGALDLLDTAADTTSSVSLGRGDGTFQTAQSYNYTGNTQSQNVAVADFNGDGIPDVASQGPNGEIGIILGASHGALSAKPSYVTACSNEYVYWIAAGDVNGDGKPDLVTTLGGTNSNCSHMVAVMLGKGTGKFDAPKYYPTGATGQEHRVYLADMNGDGHPDIVMENYDGTFSVLINKGNGTFNNGILTTSGTAIWPYDTDIAIADFNGDGKLDIAVTTHAYTDYSTNNFVYVLPGNGDGTFGAPILYSAAYNVGTPVAADFDNDGNMDLVVSAWGCNPTNGAMQGYLFLHGNGNGTFTPGQYACYLLNETPQQAVAVDLNGDGNLDVAASFSGASGTPMLLQSNGNGTFTPVSAGPYVGWGTGSLAVGDFNGDGMPDIVFGATSYYLSVLLNATQPVSVSPLNLNFGSEAVGSKKSETVILTNDQSSSLAITGFSFGGTDPGDFSQTNNCGTSRKAGWDCTITVTFKPAATGARSATLNIKDAVGTQTVQLSGTGK